MTPTCPECIDGRGQVTLFSSVRPCRTCAARRAETAAEVPVTLTYTFNITNGTMESDLAAITAKVNAWKWPPTITWPP